MTQNRIREWYDAWNGQVYVSFSGGKDSTVLKHIVDSMYDDVPSVYVNTGLEFPEIQRFVREVQAGKHPCFNSDVEIIQPEMRFDEVIRRYGYPVVSKEVAQIVREARIGIARGDGSYDYRIKKIRGELKDKNGNPSIYNKKRWEFLLDAPFLVSEKCCAISKKQPIVKYEKRTGRRAIIGTMATESALRRLRWIRHGCNAFSDKRPTSNPMSFWTEQDVLRYLKRFDVPYCSVYGEIRAVQHDTIDGQINMIDCLGCYDAGDKLKTTGEQRTGCVYCLFGCHLDPAPNRIQRLKQTHPKQYDYCMNGGEMVDGMWRPSKEGLGLRKVMEFLNIPYE